MTHLKKKVRSVASGAAQNTSIAGQQQKKLQRDSSGSAGSAQLSLLFSSELTKRSFGDSFETWTGSDDFPLEGPKAAEVAAQLEAIKRGCQVAYERLLESLQHNPHAFLGWRVAPGAMVREVKSLGREVRAALKEELQLSVFLDCCRVSLGPLEKEFMLAHGLTPEEARVELNRLLADHVSYRQNRPHLVQLTPEEALAQQARLEEGQ